MNKKLIIFFLATGFLAVMLSTKPVKKNKTFYVWFEQDSVRINLNSSIIALKKKPFKIFIQMSEPMSIVVNSSFSSKTYNKLTKGLLIDDIEVFSGDIINEKNENAHAIISDGKSSSWFYFGKENTNFNEYYQKNNKIIAIKQINTLSILSDSSEYKMEDVGKNIYISFVVFDIDKISGEKIEYQREKVKIKWLKNKK